MAKITRDDDEDWTPTRRTVSCKLKRAIDKNKKRTAAKKTSPRKKARRRQAIVTAVLPILAGPRPQRLAARKLPAPRYIVDPVWGPADPYRGASWMEVTIGPLQGSTEFYGSPPAGNTPGVMRDLLDGEYNHFGWIAGHLLNDNLGGLGELENLTPLTTAGNKNHLHTCETKIKNFIGAAYSRTDLHPRDTHYYGVYYRVEVGNTCWDDDHPELSQVATELRVWAHVVKMDKLSGAVSVATQGECPITQWFAPMVNVAVDNTGYDNLMVG